VQTEAQVIALEKAKTEKEAHGESRASIRDIAAPRIRSCRRSEVSWCASTDRPSSTPMPRLSASSSRPQDADYGG
jgi:hypothetical protein